jgi:outer membrane protein assembly factor BamB/subtilisin family serine protease
MSRSRDHQFPALRRYGLTGARALLIAGVLIFAIGTWHGPAGAVRPDGTHAPAASAPDGGDLWRFIDVNGYRFDPLAGVPALSPGLRAPAVPAAEPSYHIVQFREGVTEEMKRGLASAGPVLLHYLNYNAFLVRADAVGLARAAGLPDVRWIGPFEPAYALSPRLALDYDVVLQEALESAGLEGPDESGAPVDTRERLPVSILAMEHSRVDAIAGAARSLGGERVRTARGRSGIVRADVPRSALQRLAREPGVLWIDRELPRWLLNDQARWVIQSNDMAGFATPVHDRGLHGTGELVTVADSGIDFDHDAFQDPNVPVPGLGHRKITDYYIPPNALKPDGSPGGDDHDNADNHGTHVSGTVAGDDGVWRVYDGDPLASTRDAGPHDGQAFDATIQVQDISTDGIFVYSPTDLDDLFRPAVDRGSPIHTNSWGNCCADYIDDAAEADDFVWRNPEFTILFAGGNKGPSTGTISPYAAAKNVIGVGASGNGPDADVLTGFSSRGPARDGRRKPDVTAPGVNVWSARGCDTIGGCLADRYVSFNGTSMATPNTAGAAALVRQYFRAGFYPNGSRIASRGFVPSAALIKSILVNSGSEMTGPGAYGNDETFFPNNQQGWGRITLDDTLYLQGDARRLFVHDNRTGVARNGTVTYDIATDATAPLEITLVWSDFPGTPLTSPALVNDVDLLVTAPDGRTTYRGNQFNGTTPGESRENPRTWDRLNNVEGVIVRSPAKLQPGIWTVQVSGFSVPMGTPDGRQPYALVITGGLATRAGAIALDDTRYTSAAIVQIEVRDLDHNTNSASADTLTVSIASTTETSPEIVSLAETGPATGVFAGSIPLERRATPLGGDGRLQVVSRDTITATYFDADDGFGGGGSVTATALVDDDSPIISGVAATYVRSTHATIVWNTDEPATSIVTYGRTVPPTAAATDTLLTTAHSVTLAGLVPATTYYFSAGGADRMGNAATDTNGGAYYRFDTLAAAGPENEWPTLQNTQERQGRSPSAFRPPLQAEWQADGSIGNISRGTIVADGTLYVATSNSTIRALEPATGTEIWSSSPRPHTPRFPTVAEGAVYAVFMNGTQYDVLALDALTGELLWSVDGIARDPGSFDTGALAVSGGRVYVPRSAAVVALDDSSGSLLWTAGGLDPTTSDPTAAAGRVFIGTSRGVVAMEQQTGSIAWSVDLGGTVSAAPVHAAGRLFVVRHGDGRVYSLSAETGAIAWQAGPGLGPVSATPAFDDSSLYLAGLSGVYFAVDAANGSLRWQQPLPAGARSSLAHAEGHLYGVAEDGIMRVLDAATGFILESHPLISLSGLTVAYSAVHNGRVFVTDDAGTTYAWRGVSVDTDGDGDPDDSDCAPADPARHHGAEETCNGIDDNCLNGTDEGFDDDADDYATCGGDCDDRNAQVNPGQAEACNGVDDDCDGAIDEGFGDADGDGLNDCVDPDDDNDGYLDGDDCDPFDPSINPGRTEAVSDITTCFDGIDNDCDQVADLDCAVDASGQAVATASVSGSLADIRATSSNDIYERLTEAGGGNKKRLTVIWSFSGAAPDVPYELKFEGFRNASANDTFAFAYATRPGSCDDLVTYTSTPLTVSRTDSDGDALDSTSVGSSTSTAPLFCIRLADAANDGQADTVSIDRLFLFPAQALPACPDADGDGYAATCAVCTNAFCPRTDCDDSDPLESPGGSEGPAGDPTCSDGKDNDCDGAADGGESACGGIAETLLPNGDVGVQQWKGLPGQNYTLIDEPAPNDAADFIYIPTNEPDIEHVDRYDLTGPASMADSDRTTRVVVEVRAKSQLALSQDRFPIGITPIVDGLEQAEVVLFVPPDDAWHTLTFSQADWDGAGWTSSQMDGLRVKIRGTVDRGGRPHEVALWVTSLQVKIEASAP